MVKAIFWDNDGVLVDTENLYFRATAEVLAGLGIELTRQQFIEISLQAGGSLFSLVPAAVGKAELEALRRARNDRYAELLNLETKIVPGAEETLSSLHGRVRMAIVTSSRPEHFSIIHRKSGLLKYFDFVLTREQYVHSKPHPEPYLMALQRSGFQPEECCVIEDSERGLHAAHCAGLRCLAIPGELNRKGDFSLAERILNDIREVPSAVFNSPLQTEEML